MLTDLALSRLVKNLTRRGKRTEALSCLSAKVLLFIAPRYPDRLIFFQNVLKDDSPEWQEYNEIYVSWKERLETT